MNEEEKKIKCPVFGVESATNGLGLSSRAGRCAAMKGERRVRGMKGAMADSVLWDQG